MTSYQISQADKNCKNAKRAVATGPSDLGSMGGGGGGLRKVVIDGMACQLP